MIPSVFPLASSDRSPPGVFGRELVPVLTAEEARRLDESAREKAGVPGRVLMENAGRAAALVLHRLHPEGRVVAAVGGGDNGGDALVLVRTLRSWGREVGWVAAGPRTPDLSLLHGFDIPPSDGDLATLLSSAGVLVDGLLGTGSSGAPREPLAGMVEALNASGRPILALDLPSGADPTTGEVPGVAVRAVTTICFGAPKLGLMLPPARALCGRLLAVEIGFPPIAGESAHGADAITPSWAAARLPPRRFGAHKGSLGRLLVAAGHAGMAGAAALAGHSAVRAGAGLVVLLSGRENREILQKLVPEAIFVAREDGGWRDEAARADALVAGPAFGTAEVDYAALRELLDATCGVPTLLDADALTLLGAREGALADAAGSRPLVVTPHRGEMARITGASVGEIGSAPLDAARRLADRIGASVLLKGAPSMVAAPGEPVLLDPGGSSDFASAGMGDHLAGVAGAFLAGGASPRDAAALALAYSGRAGALAGRGRALTPRDVADALADAFRERVRSASPLGLPFITFDQAEPR